jgi:hypothetical protein
VRRPGSRASSQSRTSARPERWARLGCRAAAVTAIVLTLGSMPALATAIAPPAARAAKTTTKAQHDACERRAAHAHRRPHCAHTTTRPANAPTVQANPFADYHTPSGALITPEAAIAAAVAFAKLDGESAPTVASVKLTTRSQEIGAGARQPTFAGAGGPGYAAYLADQIYVVVLRGEFSANNAQLANGAVAPTGTVLQVAVEAHSGQITSSTLTRG